MEILNRQAKHNYFIEDTYECGIVLKGTEVKSIRAGKCNLKDSYGLIKNDEVYLLNMFISPYEQGNIFNENETRTRKLLLHKNEIRKLNNEYRNIDKSTDVLSFPMFEKEEIDNMVKNAVWDYNDILGDMVISIEQVEKQAVEYGHSFERELSYMVVHSFYHLMGYDHIKEEDKIIMRPKEEFVLERLGITR